jgi:prepilin-type N-terminal cleavage/methylation domain-containing protein
MRRGFSMIELIMTMVLMGILAGGAYISITKLYAKKAKVKAINELSLDSSRISSQISALLAYRIPASTIGYDMQTGTFESIYTMSQAYSTLEWIGEDFESYKAKQYSGFVDFDASDKTTARIASPNSDIDTILAEDNNTALIFAGSFDEGDIDYGSTFINDFGWYHHTASLVYPIHNASQDSNITLLVKPTAIYEKYYLASSAYAITRAADVNATCNLPSGQITDNTLLLYYNYKPWLGETFCQDANVTILSTEAKGFSVDFINGNLQFNLTLQRVVKKPGKDLNVTISKEKVVF